MPFGQLLVQQRHLRHRRPLQLSMMCIHYLTKIHGRPRPAAVTRPQVTLGRSTWKRFLKTGYDASVLLSVKTYWQPSVLAVLGLQAWTSSDANVASHPRNAATKLVSTLTTPELKQVQRGVRKNVDGRLSALETAVDQIQVQLQKKCTCLCCSAWLPGWRSPGSDRYSDRQSEQHSCHNPDRMHACDSSSFRAS